jgi:hypothetical protein
MPQLLVLRHVAAHEVHAVRTVALGCPFNAWEHGTVWDVYRRERIALDGNRVSTFHDASKLIIITLMAHLKFKAGTIKSFWGKFMIIEEVWLGYMPHRMKPV